MNRLKERYLNEVVMSLKEELHLENVMQVPRVKKIVVNVGIGDALEDAKVLDETVHEVAVITGQKPIITRSRKNVANFKLRTGDPIGVCVTLRGDRMWAFLDRLINVALPRVRDFRGVSPNSFDGRGNYTMGLREQLAFPEITYDQIRHIRGFEISIVTSAKDDEGGRELLRTLGMPFKEEG